MNNSNFFEQYTRNEFKQKENLSSKLELYALKRLKNFDKLGLEEKLRLLIDRDLLSKTDLVSSDSLLPLVEKFKNEKFCY